MAHEAVVAMVKFDDKDFFDMCEELVIAGVQRHEKHRFAGCDAFRPECLLGESIYIRGSICNVLHHSSTASDDDTDDNPHTPLRESSTDSYGSEGLTGDDFRLLDVQLNSVET